MVRNLALRALWLMAALAVMPCALLPAYAGVSSPESGWKLIHTDANGNGSYVGTDSLKSPDGSTVRVTMKFVNAKTATEMYFVDELDCGRHLIKRLSVNLDGPPCTGGIDYDASFEGKWDRISAGLEEKLSDAVCGEVE